MSWFQPRWLASLEIDHQPIWSEGGIPLTGYLIPGCDGIWVWTGSGVSVSSSSSPWRHFWLKNHKIQKRKWMMNHTYKKHWELLSTAYCIVFWCAAFSKNTNQMVFRHEVKKSFFHQQSDFFLKQMIFWLKAVFVFSEKDAQQKTMQFAVGVNS